MLRPLRIHGRRELPRTYILLLSRMADPLSPSQIGGSSFTRHPKLTQETTVYDEQFGRKWSIQFGGFTPSRS